MTKNTKRPPAGLPDKDTLIAFLREAGTAEKADIARHFGLKGHERRMLREMIRELEEDGKLGKRGRKGFSEIGALPPVGVADVVERDLDGELYVRLVEASADAPRALLIPDNGGKTGPAPGMGVGGAGGFDPRAPHHPASAAASVAPSSISGLGGGGGSHYGAAY